MMLAHRGIAEIPEKRFSHKRAYVWNGVRVEIFLAQPGPPDTTVMFDGRVTVHWPVNTFAEGTIAGLPVISVSALSLYRTDHDQVARAYRDHSNEPSARE